MDASTAVSPGTHPRGRGHRAISAPRTRLLAATIALVAAASLSGCVAVVQTPSVAPAPNVVGTSTDVLTLNVGDCVNDSTISGEVETLPTVSCSISHDAEVFDEVVITETDYPGQKALDAEADVACADSFPEFVGISYADSTLAFSYYVPTKYGWDDGDRIITCVISAVDEDNNQQQWTGSLKNSRI